MTGYESILIGFSLEKGHQKVLEDGLSFGKFMGTSIDVVHIAQGLPDPKDLLYYTGPELLLIDQARQEVGIIRKEFREKLHVLEQSMGIKVKVWEKEGNSAQAIVDLSQDYSLVVIGSGREDDKVKRLLGPMEQNVVRFAQSPVLVIREWEPEKRMKDIKRILVPVDGSNVANFAAAHAGLIADRVGAEVTLLHVWEKRDERLRVKFRRDNIQSDMVKDIAGRVLEDAENTMITKTKVTKTLRDGEPSEVIVEESKNYDLVVIGTWGKQGIKKFLLGCTAENVAQHANCAVLLVRGIPD